MIDCDNYFGELSPEEYEQQTKKHHEYLKHLSKVNYNKAYQIIDKLKEDLFDHGFVSDEEAEMLYHTIINWKDKSDLYDDLCE